MIFKNSQADAHSRRCTPVHPAERLASWIRHAPLLSKLDWLWNSIRPYYDRVGKVLYPEGIEWNINGTDRMLLSPRFRMVSENHEPDSWKLIMAEVWPGDVVVDVGAGIGMYTVTLAKKVGPTGRVIAFEPDPLNFRALKEHVEMNGVTGQVELNNSVAGFDEKLVNFSFGKGAYSHVSAIASSSCCVADCVRLDRVLLNRKIHLMKIDVEGYEEEVLKGGVNLLTDKGRSPRLIYIELHPWAWQQVGLRTTFSSLLNLLAKCNYEAVTLDGKSVENISGYGEIFARKRTR